MNCEEFEGYISLYIDDEIDDDSRISFKNHMEQCKECEQKYQKVFETVSLCRDLEEFELPDEFASAIIKKVKRESPLKSLFRSFTVKKFYEKGMWKAVASTAAIIVFILIVVSNSNLLNYKADGSSEAQEDIGILSEGALPSENTQYYTDNVVESAQEPGIIKRSMPFEKEEELLNNMDLSNPNKKLIRRAAVQLEVEKLDEKFNEIFQTVESKGGYVENSTVWTSTTTTGPQKMSNLILRVPEQRFDEILFFIEKMGDIKSKSIIGDDKTLEYIDLQARMRNMELQEQKLLGILDKASNVQEILEIMREVSSIRSEIESMTAQLKNWDNLVQYSTINLDMSEITSSKKGINTKSYEGLLGKVSEAFILSVNKLIDIGALVLIYIGSIVPIILLIAVIIAIIFILYRVLTYREQK
ncbi:MAG TPA: DUF4349 domain-containing protein [Thermoanaerobacterales bacterium]|nr:DUF4349 domain-containing protein [Thermoanaerobacterales bacterium]